MSGLVTVSLKEVAEADGEELNKASKKSMKSALTVLCTDTATLEKVIEDKSIIDDVSGILTDFLPQMTINTSIKVWDGMKDSENNYTYRSVAALGGEKLKVWNAYLGKKHGIILRCTGYCFVGKGDFSCVEIKLSDAMRVLHSEDGKSIKDILQEKLPGIMSMSIEQFVTSMNEGREKIKQEMELKVIHEQMEHYGDDYGAFA